MPDKSESPESTEADLSAKEPELRRPRAGANRGGRADAASRRRSPDSGEHAVDAFDPASLAEIGGQLDELVRAQLRGHPYRTLGIAAGLGFAVGGGLSSALGRTVLAFGARYVARHLLEEAARTAGIARG